MSLLARLWQGRRASVVQEARMVELPEIGAVEVVRSADCLGAACPRPQLLAMQMVEEARDGEVLELISDNPTSVETIPALVMTLYSQHLATVRDTDGWRIYIRKGLGS